jgi:hypothetical protein
MGHISGAPGWMAVGVVVVGGFRGQLSLTRVLYTDVPMRLSLPLSLSQLSLNPHKHGYRRGANDRLHVDRSVLGPILRWAPTRAWLAMPGPNHGWCPMEWMCARK